jgi:acyl-CoA synthetase (AMP-forming)/AMP-acid ligase II
VFIVDRIKDMVLRGGENVYCSEVEAAIYELDGVAEAAVFGVPDDRLGEIVGAAIVLAPGASMTEERAGGRARRAPRQVQDPRAGVVPQRLAAAQRQRQVRQARPEGVAARG